MVAWRTHGESERVVIRGSCRAAEWAGENREGKRERERSDRGETACPRPFVPLGLVRKGD